MRNLKVILLFSLICCINSSIAQESNEYIEFNDRKNIVHGVYLGFGLGYGEIKSEETAIAELKIAYVANRKLEIGLITKAIYSDQRLSGIFSSNTADLGAVYSGLHVEPILFSKAKINLSFPILIGAGAAGYINPDWENDEFEQNQNEEWDAILVAEPGINVLYNISRYFQLEAGIRYRISSAVKLSPDLIDNINGFSTSIGIKVGVFNLGRNRYKKNMPNDK